MKKIWILFLVPVLFASCSDGLVEINYTEKDAGSIVIRSNLDIQVDTPVVTRAEPDIKTFSVIIVDEQGNRTVMDYPADNTINDLKPGVYDVTLTSHPDGFLIPAFEEKSFSGRTSVTVVAGTNAEANIICTQSNTGIKFDYDQSLTEAGYMDVKPVIIQGEGSLVYDGDKKDATGYFSPGNYNPQIQMLQNRRTK